MQISRRCVSSVLALPGMMVSASMFSLGVNSAELQHESDPIDGQHICRDAIIYAMRLRVAYHFVEAVLHHIFEPFVNHTLAPEESFPVLHPFEIAHGNAAGVGQDIRDDENALGVEYLVGVGGGRAIGAFAE